jgi:hypothetical protein
MFAYREIVALIKSLVFAQREMSKSQQHPAHIYGSKPREQRAEGAKARWRMRNFHEALQPFLLGKAHGYCVKGLKDKASKENAR